MKNDRLFKSNMHLIPGRLFNELREGAIYCPTKSSDTGSESGYKTCSTSQSRAIANQTSGSQTT